MKASTEVATASAEELEVLRELAKMLDGGNLPKAISEEEDKVWDDSGRVVRDRSALGKLFKRLDEVRRRDNPHPILLCESEEDVRHRIAPISESEQMVLDEAVVIARRRSAAYEEARGVLVQEPPSKRRDAIKSYVDLELATSNMVANGIASWRSS